MVTYFAKGDAVVQRRKNVVVFSINGVGPTEYPYGKTT